MVFNIRSTVYHPPHLFAGMLLRKRSKQVPWKKETCYGFTELCIATLIPAKVVIPAKAGIQEKTGFRVKPGMTNAIILMSSCMNKTSSEASRQRQPLIMKSALTLIGIASPNLFAR
jgi:hypothetical protein